MAIAGRVSRKKLKHCNYARLTSKRRSLEALGEGGSAAESEIELSSYLSRKDFAELLMLLRRT